MIPYARSWRPTPRSTTRATSSTRRTNPANLSARESWILGHLDTMNAGALARHLSLRPSTVPEALKRLGPYAD